jgi:hypothetical protein
MCLMGSYWKLNSELSKCYFFLTTSQELRNLAMKSLFVSFCSLLLAWPFFGLRWQNGHIRTGHLYSRHEEMEILVWGLLVCLLPRMQKNFLGNSHFQQISVYMSRVRVTLYFSSLWDMELRKQGISLNENLVRYITTLTNTKCNHI